MGFTPLMLNPKPQAVRVPQMPWEYLAPSNAPMSSNYIPPPTLIRVPTDVSESWRAHPVPTEEIVLQRNKLSASTGNLSNSGSDSAEKVRTILEKFSVFETCNLSV